MGSVYVIEQRRRKQRCKIDREENGSKNEPHRAHGRRLARPFNGIDIFVHRDFQLSKPEYQPLRTSVLHVNTSATDDPADATLLFDRRDRKMRKFQCGDGGDSVSTWPCFTVPVLQRSCGVLPCHRSLSCDGSVTTQSA